MPDTPSPAAPESPDRVVFFVDDDEALLGTTRKLLDRAGYEMIEAASAEEAEEVASRYEGHIDILLMDINLPDGWGAVVAQRLRELEADGLVERTVYPVVPPKTEYALTEEGKRILPALRAMQQWGMAYKEG